MQSVIQPRPWRCCRARRIKADYQVARSSHAGRIAALYSRLAWLYDPFTDHELPHHLRAVELAAIQPGEAVLEVACGTGRATALLAQALGKDGRMQAVDLTPAMLAKARAKLARLGLLERVELRQASALALPHADNSFDLLYNSYMFDLVDSSQMPAILAEFGRVLKPGGRLVLVDMSKQGGGRTPYEWLYERGLLSFVSGACRPVLMRPLVEAAGFAEVSREYRKNRSLFPLNWLHGSEIVTARKPASETGTP
ncbi:MAG: methyltransferase domain-containing protein [Desulfarculus sp.]|nr:methyltransferase domain-containing protein [Desulfarculus sp.]